jgi:two-component system sensor histidine kinase/response regulator
LKKWLRRKNTPVGHGKKPPEAPFVVSTSTVVLPYLPGIDQEEALKILNNKTDLFVKMLYDFKKNFSSLPTHLRELSVAGSWSDIERKAHTIKGVAGYIGSLALMRAAEQLENALRNDEREAAVQHLTNFIHALDDILSSLSALPARGNTALPEKPDAPTTVVRFEEVQDALQILIGNLQRSELAAEEQFVAIEKLLAGAGFEKQLRELAELIEDIEYERAGQSVKVLLATLRQKSED